ncbi:MAG: helix-turn-helix transcriptional regulator [Rhizobacter sp.]|nr:helix-turn-helix transcriptional regulator [Ferruginibacter sp.]
MQLTEHEKLHLGKVRLVIETEYKKHYTIDDLATVALMSRSKLVKSYRQLFGMGLFEHLQTFRLELGKTLLDNSQLSIKAIAYRCGYHHPCNFTTAFKNKYGLKPMEYRKL